MPRLIIVALMLLLNNWASAQHTFSIVAIDSVTMEVGAAGATCLSSADCNGCGGAVVISDLVPGKGALNAQATVCLPNVNLQLGAELMEQGIAAEQILIDVLDQDPCSAGTVLNRQYGIITIDEFKKLEAVSHTGASALNHAEGRAGKDYAIQGNILIGAEVIDGMEQNFLASAGKPLAERLMEALQGANIPGADSRCLSLGISSKSAFLRVAKPDDQNGDFYIDLNVPSSVMGEEPIDNLQILLDELNVSDIKSVDLNTKDFRLEMKEGTLLVHTDVILENNDYMIDIHGLNGKLLQSKVLDGNPIFIPINNMSMGIIVVTINMNGKLIYSGSITIVE